MKEALLSTIKHLIRLTKEVKEAACASSLNFAVTNGEVTITTRFRNSTEEDPPSLYFTKRLRYKNSDDPSTPRDKTQDSSGMTVFKSVVISSEPLNYDEDEWELIPKNFMLTVLKSHKVTLEPIEVDEDLFVKTKTQMDPNVKECENLTCPSPRLKKLGILLDSQSKECTIKASSTIFPKLLCSSSTNLLKETKPVEIETNVLKQSDSEFCICLKLNKEFLVGLVIVLVYLLAKNVI